MYQGDEDDDLQRLLEGRDEESRSPKRKSAAPVRKKQRTQDVVPEREEYDMDDFIVRDPDDEVDSDEDDRPPGGDEAEEAPVKKTAAKRVVLNPRPKLDPDRLKSEKGLVCLLDQHANIRLKGVGHEAEDLDRVMFALEHWGHRLFPKLAFDDFIEKLEQLGSKKQVSVFVKKMRQGLPLDIQKESVHEIDSEEDDVERGFESGLPSGPALNAEEAFDRVFGNSDPSDEPPAPPAKQYISLTEEQRQEIARKRLEAIERREKAAREAQQRQNDSTQALQQKAGPDGHVTANGAADPDDASSQKEFIDMLADAEIDTV